MTSKDIFNFYNNMKRNHNAKENKSWNNLQQFFIEVANHLTTRFHNLNSITEKQKQIYWSRLLLSYAQLLGLVKGYSYSVRNEPDKVLQVSDFLIIQADGEVPELLKYFGYIQYNTAKMGDPDYNLKALNINTQDPVAFWKQLMWKSKCSAFIKILKDDQGNFKDLLSGHTTWSEYYEMLRSYKQ